MTMEYNRQVAVGGAAAAEAAKAKGTTADQRDMAFATVMAAEKDSAGRPKSNNVGPVRVTRASCSDTCFCRTDFVCVKVDQQPLGTPG